VVAVAQLAEHRIVAPKVAGSSPVGHPSSFRIDKPDTSKSRPVPSLSGPVLTTV
jgi:hypothetical protein